MFRSLKKAAQSLERGMETAFSTAPASHTAYMNKTLQIGEIRVRLGQVFAEGGFSFIHEATPAGSSSTYSTTRYAVKRLSIAEPEAAAQARHEIDFLSCLPPHQNIVRFFGATFHDGHAFLLFELIDGGTLPDVLARTQRPLSPRQRLDILGDAVAAVAHLHARDPPVAIRDVKLENLLYDRLSRCYKLCDFGSVTTVAKRFVSRREILAAEDDIANCCTGMYRAPEMVDLYAKEFVCERVDVWALGCIWYALLFGKLPFDGLSSLQILKGLQYIPQEPTFPTEYIELLKAMLTVSPAERPDSFTVLEAIRKLQGTTIDQELKRIGNELRRQRAQDFTEVETEVSTCTASNLLGLDESVPASTSSLKDSKDQAPLIDFGAFSSQPNTSDSTPAPLPELKEDNWADFDTAFGAQCALPPKAPSRTVEKGKLVATGSSAAQTDKAKSLIDFGDLQISPETMQKASGQGRPRTAAGAKAAKSAPDFCDLIDFSEQT